MIDSNAVYNQMQAKLVKKGYDRKIQLNTMEITYHAVRPCLHMKADVSVNSEDELMKLLKWLIDGDALVAIGFQALGVKGGWEHLKRAANPKDVLKQGLDKAINLSRWKAESRVHAIEIKNGDSSPQIYFDAEIEAVDEHAMRQILKDFEIDC